MQVVIYVMGEGLFSGDVEVRKRGFFYLRLLL